jgi:hypothetical protein
MNLNEFGSKKCITFFLNVNIARLLECVMMEFELVQDAIYSNNENTMQYIPISLHN